MTCPPEYGRQLLDSALRHHGVGHFLFHPAHIEEPGVADALGALIDHGRRREFEWWTNQQVYQWEMLRRGVEAKFDSNTIRLRAGKPLHQANLLMLRPGPGSRPISINGLATPSNRWSVYGFEFDAMTLDIESGVTVQLA